MSAPHPARPTRVSIGAIGISAASPLEARRLADALPGALDRAFARSTSGAAEPRRPRAADRVAAEIVRALRDRMERAP